MKRRKIDPYPEKPTLTNPSLIRVKSLEESGLLKKAISETIKNETTEQIGRLLSMLLGIPLLIPPHLLNNFEIQK